VRRRDVEKEEEEGREGTGGEGFILSSIWTVLCVGIIMRTYIILY